MHQRVNNQSPQPSLKRMLMRFADGAPKRARDPRQGLKAAAAAVAAGFLMTGCGTTPPPEPEGERIWVDFPPFEKTQKTVADPITDRNDVGSRVVVRKVETEALLPRELEALRECERSGENAAPDLRMRPNQPVPTPPVAGAAAAAGPGLTGIVEKDEKDEKAGTADKDASKSSTGITFSKRSAGMSEPKS